MGLVRLSEEPWDAVFEGVLRRNVTGRRMTMTHYRIQGGRGFPLHMHEQEQMTYLLQGSLEFEAAGERFALEPGDLIIIAPDVPHGAEARGGTAEILSVVSPARTGPGGYEVLKGSAGH